MGADPRTAEDVVFDALVANNGTETVAAPYPASLRPIARAVMAALEAYWLSPEWLDSPAARLSAASIQAQMLGELSVQAMGRQHSHPDDPVEAGSPGTGTEYAEASDRKQRTAAEACWTWVPGHLFGAFCDCGHVDLAHNRDGICVACANA